MSYDSDLIEYVRTILKAAKEKFGSAPINVSNPSGNYAETHYALSALLLYLLDSDEGGLLDLAESRLKILDKDNAYPIFFNAFAICLIKIIVKKEKIEHKGLLEVLENLLKRTFKNKCFAYDKYCGNNMYLAQVVVDMLLLPLAQGRPIAEEDVNCLLKCYRTFQTVEGFFYDLPRSGTRQERLYPPTYIMKDLFLAGVCHELHPTTDLSDIILTGMKAVLPFINDEGNFSYFGRTDNSPFAAGLTIFNLRKAFQISNEEQVLFMRAYSSAEDYFMSFPRTASGLLQCNRFADAHNALEIKYSKDDYAFVDQYTLAPCAYSMLACYWYPLSFEKDNLRQLPDFDSPSVAISRDLGLAIFKGPNYNLAIRTGTEITSWDRRYLGPTVLQYKSNNSLLIGAISRTLNNDHIAKTKRSKSRFINAVNFFKSRYKDGWEVLDGTSVGFIPVVRDGNYDYLPSRALSIDSAETFIRCQHRMVKVRIRGLYPCLKDFWELLRINVLRLKARMYRRPNIKLTSSIELYREVRVEKDMCIIEDCLSGDLKGKKLLFSTRGFNSACIEIQGIPYPHQAVVGWGSNGRQNIKIAEVKCMSNEVKYICTISESFRSPVESLTKMKS